MNSARRTLLPRLLMIALSTLGFTAAFANAQASQGKFKLPVEAHWGLAVLPPGDYTFTLDHATANGMIIVRGQGKAAIIPATAGISLSKITEQSELVLVNKIDLLPHLEFDMERFLHHLDAVHPGVPRMLVSARTGEGIDAFREWLLELPARREVPA